MGNSYHTRNLRLLLNSHSPNINIKLLIYNTTIKSIVIYDVRVWVYDAKTHLNKIQVIQNNERSKCTVLY